MKKILLVLALLIQPLVLLNAKAVFAKPRAKLIHNAADELMVLVIPSGKKYIVRFNGVNCSTKKCKTTLELGDTLTSQAKVIGSKPYSKYSKSKKRTYHTIEVKYGADSANGYGFIKDKSTGETLAKIKIIIKDDTYCFSRGPSVQGLVSFPDGEKYILNFDNMCQLERAGATIYEKI
jgi:hypothetical protein